MWLCASVKFLVPFGLLTMLARRIVWSSADAAGPANLLWLVDTMGEPFSGPAIGGISTGAAVASDGGALVVTATWLAGAAAVLICWIVRWRRVATIVRRASPVATGREFDILRRLERVGGLRRPIALVSSEAPLEPGVFGILDPVLLLPQPVAAHLDDQQVEAILLHELSHAVRRDNLAAFLHMLVEAFFWFHPLVWWIGVHLVDEREQACDDEVIRRGSDRLVYAESILEACRTSVESPLRHVAGVGGSDLVKRLERIMTRPVPIPVNGWKLSLLAAAAIATIGVPLGAVLLEPAPVTHASTAPTAEHGPAFATATVTPNNTGDAPSGFANRPGGFELRSVTLGRVIANAWRLHDFQISGAPDWFATERFDIVATANGNPPMQEKWLMVRTLLAEHFKLRVHSESRETEIYDLVLARADRRPGPRLRRSPAPCGQAVPGAMPCGYLGITIFGELTARADPIEDLARRGIGHILGAVVVDRTGLGGYFDADLEWKPSGATARRSQGRSAFESALRDQLGLDAVRREGAVEILVIDGVERPQR